jgi:hypothetical protein
MKNVKYLFGLLFTVAILSAAAAAQGHSLHAVHPDDQYVSQQDGFEIGLPADLVKEENLSDGRSYSWDFSEGLISVTIRTFPDGSAIKNDADVGAFLKGFKGALIRDTGVKFISESPARIGDYSGASYLVTYYGNKTMLVVLAWKKFNIFIRGVSNGKIEGSDQLVFNALKTFELHSNAK